MLPWVGAKLWTPVSCIFACGIPIKHRCEKSLSMGKPGRISIPSRSGYGSLQTRENCPLPPHTSGLQWRVMWGTVALLWVTYFLNYIDRQVVFSIFPALKADLHFSDTQLGLIGSVFTWVYSICMAVSGRAADLFRRDRLIIGSLALCSVATLGTSASHSVTSFLVWRAVALTC